ncbi:MAG TPA: hypothetical protein VL172_07675, partial [Kofleriaceae bacterium]|nr:hypothetical protein [Kofleriaceae bacterium]
MKTPLILAAASLLLPACMDDPEVGSGAGAASNPGALIQMQLRSTVGVNLEDIPAGALREAAAAGALSQPASFWTDRAARQTRLTYYRLVFRGDYYSSDWSSNKHDKGPLPLPPRKVWNVHLTGTPHRDLSGGHDMVVVDYTFDTYIVSD